MTNSFSGRSFVVKGSQKPKPSITSFKSTKQVTVLKQGKATSSTTLKEASLPKKQPARQIHHKASVLAASTQEEKILSTSLLRKIFFDASIAIIAISFMVLTFLHL